MPEDAAAPEPTYRMMCLPVTGPIAGDLELALKQYAEACSAVKVSLQAFESDKGSVLYTAAKETKTARYDQCKEVFERVLAHIGVRAP